MLGPCYFCSTICHFQLWNHIAVNERASLVVLLWLCSECHVAVVVL